MDLHCCVRAFSSCSQWGLPFLAVCEFSGFSLHWFLLWWSKGSRPEGSVVAAHRLSCPAARGIFPDQESSHTPWTGRQTLNHWTTKEVLNFFIITHRTTLSRCSKVSEQFLSNSLTLSGTSNRAARGHRQVLRPHRSSTAPGCTLLPGCWPVRGLWGEGHRIPSGLLSTVY